jgi:hypothetical protein
MAEKSVTDRGDHLAVGFFRAGAIDDGELNHLIVHAWSDAIADPTDGEEIAMILGITKENLQTIPPPLEAKVRSGGITGAEMVLAFAAPFAVAYAKELGGETGQIAGKATLKLVRKIWDKVLSRRIRSAEAEALGEERSSEEE